MTSSGYVVKEISTFSHTILKIHLKNFQKGIYPDSSKATYPPMDFGAEFNGIRE